MPRVIKNLYLLQNNMLIPEVSLKISASSVAWYGAVVATIGAVVSIYNAWRDRAQIKIDSQKNMRIMNARPPYLENKDYFSVNITNRGRRPVAIGNVGMKYFSGKTFILAASIDDQHTRILTEEKPRTSILTDQSTISFQNLYCVLVYDQAGREYIKYFHQFPTFRKCLYKIRIFLGVNHENF